MRIDQVFNKALAKHNAGDHAEAIKLYRMVLMKSPMHLDANYLLGTAYAEIGMLEEAKKYLLKSEKLMPKSPFIKVNLGNIYKEEEQYELAIDYYSNALGLKQDFPDAHCNLGVALFELGRLDEAQNSYLRALEKNPNFAEAHYYVGKILMARGSVAEAETRFRRALEIKPDYAEAINDLGNALAKLGHQEDAENCYKRALEIRPEYAEAINNQGNTLVESGHLSEAENRYRHALVVNPEYDEAQGNLLFCKSYSANRNSVDDMEEARKYGRIVAGKVKTRYSGWLSLPRPVRLRVGMVSGDLCEHPVGYFLENVLAHLDQTRIELIAYPTHCKTDELTARIKPNFSDWKPLVGLNDAAAARLIHADGVHLLLDLSGHTGKNRLPVFAWKPAPVQTTWLGYFATTGVAEMDYLLGDPHVTPAEEAGHFTETVWQLPETYLCFSPPADPIEIGSLPARTPGHITFGSFNNLTKMNCAVVALWARTLLATPHAQLFLKNKQLDDQRTVEATRQRFAAYGVATDRIILEGSSPRHELLQAYNRVDIALDPFPYPGGTTSAEALWMGVPVITLKGNRFLSHVGESIAHNVGLADWIAATEDDYVAKAVAYAHDIERLATLRSTLRHQVLASPLYNASRFARNLEAALWGMWEKTGANL